MNDKIEVVSLIGFSALAIAGVFGWAANIVQIVGMIDGDVTAMFIFKCIGICFAPLGAILGIIGLF